MNSIPCALVVAFFVSLAVAAPTTTIAPSANKTMLDSMGIGQTVTIGDLGQFVIVFGVSPCMSACMDNMTHAFNNTDTDIELDHHVDVKFQDICDIYFAAAACFRKCPDGDDHLFDVISAGANYMCVEERAAYERAMPCIRKEKKALKQACDKKCATPQEHDVKRIEKVEKKTKGKSIHSTTPTTTTSTQSSNSSDSLAVIGGLCDVLHCSIECGRDFLNGRCPKDLHAGNLLTELIIRPLEKNAEFMKEEMSPEEEMSLAQSLPKQCLFIGDEEELNAFRGNWTLEDSKKENLHEEARPHKKTHPSIHKSKTTTTTSTTKLPASKAATSTTKVSASSSTTSTSTTDIPSTTKESRTRRPL